MSEPVGVVGGGAWGTALAVHAVRAGFPVRLWTRTPAAARRLAEDRENKAYLPGVELPEGLQPTAALDDLAECEPLFIVVPSHGLRSVVQLLVASLPEREHLTLVSAAKGIEAETSARMSEILAQEAVGAGRLAAVAVLSGPTFAAELAAGTPSAAVMAAGDEGVATGLCERFSTGTLRLYSSTDLVGVELGGAAKNVIAIGAGLVSGLGLGHNTLAALITRGLHEITRLGVACGGNRRTLAGLAGLGDLVLTCTGGLSRNRRAGMELAKGTSLDQLMGDHGRVAEGLRNAATIVELARERQIELPIIEQMYAVIYEGKPAAEAVRALMHRDLKAEADL